MQIKEWMAYSQNQETLERLSRQAIAELAPDELPLLEEMYPQYVKAAQAGNVQPGTKPQQAFSLSGDAHLLLVIVIPLLAATLAAWTVRQSLGNGGDADSGANRPDRKRVKSYIDNLLPRDMPTSAARSQVLELLVALVLEALQ